jgi:hypothetical protein
MRNLEQVEGYINKNHLTEAIKEIQNENGVLLSDP